MSSTAASDAVLRIKRADNIIGILEDCKKKLGPAIGMTHNLGSPMFAKDLARIYDNIKAVQDALWKEYIQ